jgi:folate-dependent tRNA-U54 methylase TrmFO/GidA
MTKREALDIFREFELPAIRQRYEKDGRVDHPARREGWNNYTDALCKAGQITMRQYETWGNPF